MLTSLRHIGGYCIMARGLLATRVSRSRRQRSEPDGIEMSQILHRLRGKGAQNQNPQASGRKIERRRMHAPMSPVQRRSHTNHPRPSFRGHHFTKSTRCAGDGKRAARLWRPQRIRVNEPRDILQLGIELIWLGTQHGQRKQTYLRSKINMSPELPHGPC